MKTLIQRLISTGADFSTKNALKNTLHYLGIDPENIDKLYIELKNSMYKDSFKEIPPKEKIVFLPQCLRNSKTCKAVLGQSGWICKKCSGHTTCKVYKIKEKSESLGYKVFIVPGVSMVFKIIENLKPMGVLGVACMKELTMATEALGIPAQGIQLLRDGCVNTDVNLKEVINSL